MSLLQFSALEFEKLLLIILRVGGIMTVAPIFGHRNVPKMVKIGLILVLSLILLPTLSNVQVDLPPNLFAMAGVLVKEIAAGLAVGFTSLLLFIAVQFAGNIIGLQMGFGIVNVIDPNSQAQVPLIGQFQFILAMLIFLSLNGHHMLISAISGSFQLIPLGQVTFTNLSADIMVRAIVDTVSLAVKLGAPCIVTLFLLDVSLGIIARTVPQMNIFIVGFPLKISVGLLMLATSMPIVGYVFSKLLQGLSNNVNNLIMAMRPA
ncbi:MAG: flagellar type III secretion system protein FliR [candidate division Zixibacteria bacterium]|nr:flagellar type III secretion system protein FliR [candidate division Zixibacteria bacterium]